MDQMNVSITERLAGYVREKVASGRYNNVSEVVREALRRMEEEDERATRLAHPTVEDILGDLTAIQAENIRRNVRAGIGEMERSEFTELNGRRGLDDLRKRVKTRGKQRAAAGKA
jgi:antitoxin ParD1/3/4